MLQQSELVGGTGNPKVGPVCPQCGHGSFTFSEVHGTSSSVPPLQARLVELEQEYKNRAAAVINEYKDHPAGSTSPPADPDEDAYLLLLSDDPKEARRLRCQEKLDALKREFGAVKHKIVARLATSTDALAIVHCAGCGHIIGVAGLPRCQERAIERVERQMLALQ